MKIAIATAVYYPMVNGVAMFSHSLAVGLARRGHEVMVICPSQTGENYTEMEEGVKVVHLKSIKVKIYPDQIHEVPIKRKVLGVRIPRLLYKYGFRVSVFPAREVEEVLSEFKPDVVHVQVSDPIGLSVAKYARECGIPVVTTEHNQPEVITAQFKLPGVIKKPMDALLAAYFISRQRKSDFVTMPTRLAIDNLFTARGKSLDVPMAVVSNGVDLSHFSPGVAPAEIYEKYGIPQGCPIVLYVGRVDPEKSVDLILKGFARIVAEQGPEARLVIVGDGTDKPRLVQMAEELGVGDKVIFVGRVLPPDLYDIYKVGTVFATASEIETQGIVLIEAAASGLPLIAVDKGAVAEICRTNENGYLVTPRDRIALGIAMMKLIKYDDIREEFAKKSVEVAHEHDIERTLDVFEHIYNRVIGEKK